MARLARLVIPGIPHQLTQRGNRRQPTFFGDDDYHLYRSLLAESCGRAGVKIWAYCLMPNHVHLIAVPETEEALARGIGEAHRRYTVEVNRREGWSGYLWQGRFGSFPLDDAHLYHAARYVEQNPVRARLVAEPWDYEWSSARAHCDAVDDELVSGGELLKHWPEWREVLRDGLADGELEVLRRHERTGRPLGSDEFVERLESATGRRLKLGRPGRPKK